MVYFLIFAAAALRLVDHPANFAPIAAMALFGGVYLNRKLAFVLPIAAMVVSDYFIGFDSLESRAVVYSCFLLSGLIGLYIRDHKTPGTVVGGTLASSVLFYLITNLVFLYPEAMYEHNLIGQMQSYINALPFFRNTLAGDLFYVGILFGAYEAVRYYKTSQMLARNKFDNR